MGKHTRERVKALLLCLVVFLQSAVLVAPVPMKLSAQESPSTETSATPSVPPPPTEPPAEIRRPTGSAAHTFTYNFETGLWENEYYTWNPHTNVRTAKFAPEHTYNDQAGVWEIREWVYIASEKTYRYRVTSTYTLAPLPVAEVPATPQEAPATEPLPDNKTNQQSQTMSIAIPSLAPTNAVAVLPNSQSTVNLSVTPSLSTSTNSTATSGNASVLQNTNAGNATSGDAQVMANIINMIQSVWGAQGLQPNVFSADIQGNYYGDIVIHPSELTAQTNHCNCDNLEVNTTIDAVIENDVNLLAQSGDANVSSNTSAGGATSGDAHAVANIINMINSSITSGQSFLGVLNVHGNLEGDVLLPETMMNKLIAANIPHTTLPIGSESIISLDDNHSITSNVSVTAVSGNATVANNTSAGSARSGEAQTNVTVFNITGRQIIGDNAFLVFVNVSGKWVGFITDAPAGSTAALLGSTTDSCAACGSNLNANVETNATITNNVSVTARTGNATVQNNTFAGDATSGDAHAAANIGNISNSSFSLSNWFGILFINIFGDWYGSFGTDTAYGGMTGSNNVGQTPATGTNPRPIIGNPEINPNTAIIASPPAMKVFSARFTVDEEGNQVLVAATEHTPPTDNSAFTSPDPSSAPLFQQQASRDFSSLFLVLAAAAAFVVILHGDSIKALAFRTRQF